MVVEQASVGTVTRQHASTPTPSLIHRTAVPPLILGPTPALQLVAASVEGLYVRQETQEVVNICSHTAVHACMYTRTYVATRILPLVDTLHLLHNRLHLV